MCHEPSLPGLGVVSPSDDGAPHHRCQRPDDDESAKYAILLDLSEQQLAPATASSCSRSSRACLP